RRVTRGVVMMSIREIVRQALETNYLSLEAEEHLRRLLRCKYGKEDLRAFMQLQRSVMNRCVRQESRELRKAAAG
ncbi:MAG: hypothetical protein SVX43_13810, partial [Cyanobacteriota bacterium]|nr:hypothetical protein [Cyanobacteriota bacterium]